MKRKLFINISLILGLSLKSFAATGSANDGLEFLLVIVGLLLIVLGLIYGVDYLKKNGKRLTSSGMAFLKKKITFLSDYFLHRSKRSSTIQSFRVV